jgi:hypothetical protein
MKKFTLFFSLLLVTGLISANIVWAKTSYNVKVPLPGASKANLKLQVNTLPSVYTAAAIKVPNCKKFSVTDTAIIKQPYDLIKENDRFVSGFW